VLGGIGLAALSAGAGLGLVAIEKKNASNADGHCDASNQCDEVGLNLRAEGWTAGTASTAFFIAGGVAVAGGVVLFATAPAGEGVSARIAAGPRGVELRGAW
jgi:hypothetical protein